MLYKKEGLPEEDEIVLCTVSNVQHHSVKLLQSFGNKVSKPFENLKIFKSLIKGRATFGRYAHSIPRNEGDF